MAEKQEKACFRTSIGGQALIEGILMRGPKKQAIVVRAPDGIVTKVEEYTLPKDKFAPLGWPIIRGTANFISSLTNGVKALMYSAEFFPEDENAKPSKLDKWIEEHFSNEKAEKLIITVSVVLGVLLAVGLFMILPTLITSLVSGFIDNRIVNNLIEGAVRIAIFLTYLALVSKMNDIKRVWQYHGAEHKAIFCYESGLELTVENCRSQPRLHPRCGTSFMFIAMIVSILVLSVVTWESILMRLFYKMLLLPVTVGISYEIIKLAGRCDNAFTRIISAPGKALQKITTAEPDDSMLEVAIESLKLVLPDEEGTDKW